MTKNKNAAPEANRAASNTASEGQKHSGNTTRLPSPKELLAQLTAKPGAKCCECNKPFGSKRTPWTLILIGIGEGSKAIGFAACKPCGKAALRSGKVSAETQRDAAQAAALMWSHPAGGAQ